MSLYQLLSMVNEINSNKRGRPVTEEEIIQAEKLLLSAVANDPNVRLD